MRAPWWSLALLLLLPPLPGVAAGTAKTAGEGADPFARLERTLWAKAKPGAPEAQRAEAYARLNQLRNHEAMEDLLGRLPPDKRPTRILYAASGDHMAPLALCAADQGKAPYAIIFTEVDPSVERGIDAFLRLLVRERLASELSSSKVPEGQRGDRIWRFDLGRHPVTLTLVLNPTEAREGEYRLYPAWAFAQSDLVVTHDWAGDQQENLRLVWELLRSAREGDASRAPLMMLEDLESHPYPVDLSFFSPVARTSKPYGHRLALRLGPGLPTNVELGPPLYGGGVLLGFTDRWWTGLDDTSLACVFNFLLFNQFDNERTNVVEGGSDPVFAPASLDWATGFGYRAIDGQDVRVNRNIKPAMMERAPALAGAFPPTLRGRWACRMVLYRALLELEAGGDPLAHLFPPSRFRRRLGDPSFPFPNAAVEAKAREAEENTEGYAAAKARERETAAALLKLAGTSYLQCAAPCLPSETRAWPVTLASWRLLYESALAALRDGGPRALPP